MKDKKVVYLLFVFPDEQVIADRLNKNNYDVGHIAPIININKFLYGWRSENNSEYICDCCGDTFRTEYQRDEHINRGYADKTGQYKLNNKNHFFTSYSCCSRNPFIEYGDIETDMEKLGPDDDWDSEHVPHAIELHAVSKYNHLYEMFDIPLHFRAQVGEVVPVALSRKVISRKTGTKCEAIMLNGKGKICNKIDCYIPSHKAIIKQLIENYLLKFYEKKLLSE